MLQYQDIKVGSPLERARKAILACTCVVYCFFLVNFWVIHIASNEVNVHVYIAAKMMVDGQLTKLSSTRAS